MSREFLEVFPPLPKRSFKADLKITRQPVGEWVRWIDSELTPPIEVSPEVAYVLKAFREALITIQEATN